MTMTIDDSRAGRPSSGPARWAGSTRAPARHRHVYQWLFAAPAIVLVVVFFFVPFVANVFFAFTRWTGYSSVISFNGLTNFANLLDLGILGHATLITLCYAIIGMAVQNTAGLALAKALQHTGRSNTVFRAVFFVPVLISPLAAGYIWKALLQPQGYLDEQISRFVPGDFTFNWLGHGWWALVAVACIEAWKWSGMATLVYIAGLNRIPRQLIEASILDGAGPIRRYFHIEFPLLAPAFTFNIVITFVGAFSAFDVIASTTGGGPGDATSVLNMAVYSQYGQGFFGTASALTLVVTLLVVVFAVPLIFWLRRREARI
jgi:multiple sugar transport system permease protein/raffinose/stachyose/melibiose transport system permease protein